MTVKVDLTPPVEGEMIDGLDTNFKDLQYSPSKTNVAVQWKDFSDPESAIREYATQVLIQR